MIPRTRPLLGAGLLLGVGLGGFADGILLHQILQWHNMLSSRVPPTDLVAMKYNMVWDGLFHALTWVLTAIGVGLLWSRSRRGEAIAPDRALVGWLVVGWGAFNVLDEIVSHALLGLHHIREGEDELAYDMGFLALGVLQVVVGALLVRSSERRRLGRA